MNSRPVRSLRFILPMSVLFAHLAFADAVYEAALAAEQLLAIPRPDLSGTETAVQETLRSARASLDKILASGAVDEMLAIAMGEMGELYHSHHVYVPAESCYVNAMRMAPEEFRWPYYYGYLMVQTSRPDKAAVGFESALGLRPDDAPTRLRLANVYLDLGRFESAEAIYSQLQEQPQVQAAALYGLGRVALVRDEAGTAIPYLQQVLKLQPQASKVHYSLAMAYRKTGDVNRARDQLALYGEGVPEIDDPWLDRLNELSTGVRTLYYRAIAAVHDGHHEKAVAAFEQALQQDPQNLNARVSLARSLYLVGRRDEARGQLESVLHEDPDRTLARFLLGVLMYAAGAREQAVTAFEEVLSKDFSHAGAQHFLADTYMASGNYQAAMQSYAAVLRHSPDNLPAHLALALATWRADEPQQRVRLRLEQSLLIHPEQPSLLLPLARLLAASPDVRVRDGERALMLAEKLFTQEQVLENAETLAMAYAEVGRFADAAALQRNAFDAAFKARRIEALPRLDANLRLYQQNKPCREPFRTDDPLWRPRPVDPAAVFREYPSRAAY